MFTPPCCACSFRRDLRSLPWMLRGSTIFSGNASRKSERHCTTTCEPPDTPLMNSPQHGRQISPFRRVLNRWRSSLWRSYIVHWRAITWAKQTREHLVSCEELPAEELPAPQAARLVEEQPQQAEAMDEAYTRAGTQVTRGVRLVLVLRLDNLRSVLDNPGFAEDNRGSAAAGASVSLAVGCHCCH